MVVNCDWDSLRIPRQIFEQAVPPFRILKAI